MTLLLLHACCRSVSGVLKGHKAWQLVCFQKVGNNNLAYVCHDKPTTKYRNMGASWMTSFYNGKDSPGFTTPSPCQGLHLFKMQ